MSTKLAGLLLTILFMASTAPPAWGAPSESPSAPEVRVLRVPEGGIQPQAVVDGHGKLHLICFRGDDGHGDIFYVTSVDGGRTFAPPLQVNSRAGSAIAIGNIRGAHLAVGRNGRAHVAWMGTDRSAPGPESATPMVYARL